MTFSLLNSPRINWTGRTLPSRYTPDEWRVRYQRAKARAKRYQDEFRRLTQELRPHLPIQVGLFALNWHEAGPHNQACIGYGGKDAKPHADPAIQAKAERFAVLMERLIHVDFLGMAKEMAVRAVQQEAMAKLEAVL